MRDDAVVFVVDDDKAMRKSLTRLLDSVGLNVETFDSAEAFLADCDPSRHGCLILDIRMPGISGLELQKKLAADGVSLPVIIMSAHGDVEKAVSAIKCGAVDFIKKPYKGKLLLARIREALALDARLRSAEAERAEIEARLDRLTPREREVSALLVTGKHAKQIALVLGLSRKTVDVHRAHIMTKMQADSLVELARMMPTPRTDLEDHA